MRINCCVLYKCVCYIICFCVFHGCLFVTNVCVTLIRFDNIADFVLFFLRLIKTMCVIGVVMFIITNMFVICLCWLFVSCVVCICLVLYHVVLYVWVCVKYISIYGHIYMYCLQLVKLVVVYVLLFCISLVGVWIFMLMLKL